MGSFNRYGAITDTLLVYARSDTYQFYEQIRPSDPVYLERFKFKDELGRIYRVDNLTIESALNI